MFEVEAAAGDGLSSASLWRAREGLGLPSPGPPELSCERDEAAAITARETFSVAALLDRVGVHRSDCPRPNISVILSAVIANTHGCKLDEGSVHSCVIDGKDYGQLLYTLGVLGWLMLATIPAGALAGIVWLILLLFHRAGWQKRNQRAL